MNRDVVEGNPTSLRPSTRFPDPQESLALMDLSHLHMNDLGLTPSPGFQLGGKSLQDKEHEAVDTAGDCTSIERKGKETGYEGSEGQPSDTIDCCDDSYDPLFDSTVPELDFFFSRKRTAEELPGFPPDFPPEKRQHLESADETPSLTTESTHESPASFFDTFDNLFGGGFHLPLELPHEPLPDFEEPTPQPALSPPRISESTRNRFFLNEQDILANITSEILQVGKQPEYTSPYPAPGGPLGYLPSTPAIHVKCVAVGDERKDTQILNLRAELAQLTRERDEYKNASQCAKTNDAGKTPEQLLREENAMLRRVSSRHQTRVEDYKKEAAEWKNQLHVVSTLYNNLLYEIRVEKRVPFVASIPAGYKRPRLSASVQEQIVGHLALQNGGYAPAPLPSPQISVQSVQSVPGTRDNSQHPEPTAQQYCPEKQTQAVTIDLTEENDDPPSLPPSEAEPCTTTLQSLRSKKYDWLQARKPPPESPQSHGFPSTDDGDGDGDLALLMEQELSRA
ncbi:hypothetical protein BJX76DRAFT_14016 [Aspergillus varians]